MSSPVSLACVLSFAASLFFFSSAAGADEGASAAGVNACLSHHRQGQLLERDGNLLGAMKEFRECLVPQCSAIVRADCADNLEELERQVPTIVLAAVVDGMDLSEVSVFREEELLTERLEGAPISLNPGPHLLRFESEDREPVTLRIVLRAGEQNRIVQAEFASEESTELPPAALEEDPAPVTSSTDWFVVGAFSSAAVLGIAGGVLGVTTRLEYNKAESECAPECSGERVNAIRTKGTISDVLLIGSGVALTVGTVRLLTRSKESREVASVGVGWGGIDARVRF